jgi:hypothetical protein
VHFYLSFDSFPLRRVSKLLLGFLEIDFMSILFTNGKSYAKYSKWYIIESYNTITNTSLFVTACAENQTSNDNSELTIFISNYTQIEPFN